MSAAGPLDPDRLAAAEFSTAFRGYDTGEVRALLMTVGTALREAAEREHELREQLARAEHHLRELRETTAAQVEEAAEEARREGREMVAEAQRVRERMLGDLARRRRNARPIRPRLRRWRPLRRHGKPALPCRSTQETGF